MDKKFLKLWPYALGVLVLGLGAILGPKILDNSHSRPAPAHPTVRTAAGSTNEPLPSAPAASGTNGSAETELPGGLKPIMAKKPDMAMYRLIADGLIKKLRPPGLSTTLAENDRLCASTAEKMRTEMGLALPDGYVIPKGIPQGWVEQPTFTSLDDYYKLSALREANRAYTQVILNRLMDEYANQTVDLLSRQFAEVPRLRRPGDTASFYFVRSLYGDTFVTDYIEANRKVQRDQNNKLVKVPIPQDLVERAEAAVSTLWRTEFSDEDFLQLKEMIVSEHWGEKLREDFLRSQMTAAESGLMEKTLLGFRLSMMHALTTQTVGTYASKVSSKQNTK